MERTPTRRGLAALSVAAGLLAASAASAHPHMWIDARAVIDLDADKRITAVRQVWRFDEMFGAYATQGLKRGKDGSLSADTRAGMARDWMKALGEPISHYFTRVSVDGKSAAFRRAARCARGLGREGRPSVAGSRCRWPSPWRWARTARRSTSMTRPISSPMRSTKRTRSRWAGRRPRPATGPTASPELDWKTMQQLAAIPADPDALPEELFAIKGLTHRIEVRCP